MKTDDSLLRRIMNESGQPVNLCFQCRKCSAGCPMIDEFDFPPNMVMRMIQLGRREELLASKAIWMCVSCETCGARCPNGIEIAPVMDCLRAECLEEGVIPADKTAVGLHTAFTDNVKVFGRLHEATMLMLFKLRDKKISKDDIELGVKLLLRGKIPLLPRRSKDLQKIRELFKDSGR
ncbi:MAG: 4Fe-4S dicluster domain-containing protein [Spirochaetales bacterium]|nr:4Fe-4S dicluster domain-containing protein [Spirochaetales bacterium]